MSDIFTAEDVAEGTTCPILGPAYFAARRAAEAIMQGTEGEPFKKIVVKVTDELRDGLFDYATYYLVADLERHLQGYIQQMVERTVRALLTGEPWAMEQYPLAKYCDGEAIRKAVAKHGGDQLLVMRITELEAEVARLTEALRYAR